MRDEWFLFGSDGTIEILNGPEKESSGIGLLFCIQSQNEPFKGWCSAGNHSPKK